MPMEDVTRSLLTEIGSSDPEGTRKQPAAGVDDGSLAAEKNSKPKPNEPDPEEVQYTGYFKDGGSL